MRIGSIFYHYWVIIEF